MDSKKFFIETYGCQMNEYDSELLAGILTDSGYTRTELPDQADALFLNTCAIRENAETTVLNRLQNFKHLKKRNPKLRLGLLGCMAQNLQEGIREKAPYVDMVFGPDSYRFVPEALRSEDGFKSNTDLEKLEMYDQLYPKRELGVNAWISIMRGCDNYCAYCIVPYVRGPERSRGAESIIQEARQAIADGFVEITLLGQSVLSYRDESVSFAKLLEQIANLPGLRRLRFMSPHPKDMNEEIIQLMAEHPVISKHIHLPLQSGSDKILKGMFRKYSQKEFLHWAGLFRERVPGNSITTDIIVGFPGESDADFQETLKVVERVEFNNAFMFKFSPRPGTAAENLTDRVPEMRKQERLEELIETEKQFIRKKLREKVGQNLEVLVEKSSKKSDRQWAGRTIANDWVIFDKGQEKVKDFVNVQIFDAQGVTLFGKAEKCD